MARSYIRRERIKKLLRQLSYEQLEYIEAVAQLQKEDQQIAEWNIHRLEELYKRNNAFGHIIAFPSTEDGTGYGQER